MGRFETTSITVKAINNPSSLTICRYIPNFKGMEGNILQLHERNWAFGEPDFTSYIHYNLAIYANFLHTNPSNVITL